MELRDHAERPPGADHETREIEPRDVLHHPPTRLDHAPCPIHALEAEHQRARHAQPLGEGAGGRRRSGRPHRPEVIAPGQEGAPLVVSAGRRLELGEGRPCAAAQGEVRWIVRGDPRHRGRRELVGRIDGGAHVVPASSASDAQAAALACGLPYQGGDRRGISGRVHSAPPTIHDSSAPGPPSRDSPAARGRTRRGACTSRRGCRR